MAETAGKYVVVVTQSVYKKAGHIFDAIKEFEVIVSADDEQALSSVVSQAHPVAVVIGSERYTGPLYRSLQRGALIARFGVGCDSVDFEQAHSYGLVVTNTPEVLESTVAELTVFLAGEVLRRVGFAHAEMLEGKWAPRIGMDLHGKVWAIIGMGAIGVHLSRILSRGFGVKVIACKRNIVESEKLREMSGASLITSDFGESVREADIVSMHIPASKHTLHYLNAARLKLLKKGAVIINTGRGALIDENALYDVLKEGYLAGAGLDVFENEPYVPVNPKKDLRSLPNVVMTPHIGSSTVECLERMAQRVIRNIRLKVAGEFESMDVKSS